MSANGRLAWLSPRLAACVFMAASGVVHFAITVEHSEHAPAHGLFFALLGTLPLGWAAAPWIPSLASSSPFASTADEAYAQLCGLPRSHAAHTHAATHIRLDNALAGGYLVRAVTSPGTDRPEDLVVEV